MQEFVILYWLEAFPVSMKYDNKAVYLLGKGRSHQHLFNLGLAKLRLSYSFCIVKTDFP